MMDTTSPRKAAGGLVVMVDGPDGVGKTTQLRRIGAALEAQGYEVYQTRTHGGTPLGEALREVSFSDFERSPKTDMFISLAMHSELSRQIAENRERGIITLVDRSPLSNIAYQAYGSGLDKDYAYRLIDDDLKAFGDVTIIVYQAPYEVFGPRMQGPQAANAAHTDYFESKPSDYFIRVAEGFREAAEHYRAHSIDASGSLDEVYAATMQVIQPILDKTSPTTSLKKQ